MENYRKDIRLKNYDYRQNGAYFITITSHHRTPFFASSPLIHEIFENTFVHIEKKFSYCQVLEKILMPNHVHFILLFSGNDSLENRQTLSVIIQEFKSLITREVIEKVKAGQLTPFNGKIWQKGFYEHILRSEEELYQVRKYIRENPEKLALLQEEWKKKKCPPKG